MNKLVNALRSSWERIIGKELVYEEEEEEPKEPEVQLKEKLAPYIEELNQLLLSKEEEITGKFAMERGILDGPGFPLAECTSFHDEVYRSKLNFRQIDKYAKVTDPDSLEARMYYEVECCRWSIYNESRYNYLSIYIFLNALGDGPIYRLAGLDEGPRIYHSLDDLRPRLDEWVETYRMSYNERQEFRRRKGINHLA